jgi:hypothetical protein
MCDGEEIKGRIVFVARVSVSQQFCFKDYKGVCTSHEKNPSIDLLRNRRIMSLSSSNLLSRIK